MIRYVQQTTHHAPPTPAEINSVWAEILDELGAAILVLDARGHLLNANAGGRDLLKTGTIVRTLAGRVSLLDQRAERKLYAALANLARPGDENVVVTAETERGELFICRLLRLPGANQDDRAEGPTVALFVRKAILDMTSSNGTLAEHFKLTPAELRVLMVVLEGCGAQEVARKLHVSVTTVKTHLRRLFAKTDTRRQADLVRLAAAFANPIGSSAKRQTPVPRRLFN